MGRARSARKPMEPPIWCDSVSVQSLRPSSTARTAGCAARRLGPGGSSAADGEFPGVEIAVDIDQRHRGRDGDAQLTAVELDKPAARLVDQVVPAGAPKFVG